MTLTKDTQIADDCGENIVHIYHLYPKIQKQILKNQELANELNSSLFCGEYWCICGKCVIKDLSLLIEDAEKWDKWTKQSKIVTIEDFLNLQEIVQRLKKRIEELNKEWDLEPDIDKSIIITTEINKLQKILGDEK